MTPESPESFPETLDIPIPRPPARRRPRYFLLTGVAGAALLGVGLGFWARPAESERPMAAPAQPTRSNPLHRLQIVVDDRSAPIGPPIEVLPARAEAKAPTPPPIIREWLAPTRPPEALTRVRSVTPPPEPVAEPAEPKPRPTPTVAPAPKPRRIVVAEAKPVLKPAPKPSLKVALKPAAKVEAKPEPRPSPKAVHLAKAPPPTRAVLKAAARPVELARAPQPPKAGKVDKVRLAKSDVRIAMPAEQKRQKLKQQTRQASFVREDAHAPPPHRARPADVRPPPPKLARAASPRPAPALKVEPKVRPASVRKPTRSARPPVRAHAPPPAATPRPAGLMMVSITPPLAAEDRQMARAYQEARAAGVPEAQLQRQQQRWLSARSAAAHEAPWALRDVYLARIAELNGQAREARPEGY